jgi:hypothetical protein
MYIAITRVVYRARYASVYRIRYIPNTDRADRSVLLGIAIPAQPCIQYLAFFGRYQEKSNQEKRPVGDACSPFHFSDSGFSTLTKVGLKEAVC